jgi:NodT family efflux transporter outer membrane factor (OMF) lipoprotein
MSMGRHIPRLALGIELLLGGCTGPFQTPVIETPSRYAHAPADAPPGFVAADWWQALDDRGLNAAVARTLAGNRDLAQAQLRIRTAGLAARLAGRDQWPTLSGSLSGQRTRASSAYRADLAVTLDPDLSGRLAATTAAADATARAVAEDAQTTRLALIVSTCDLYWDLGFTHQQLATGQATLTDQRRILDLVGVQRTFGRVSSLEVAEAQAAIAAQETALSALQQHLVEDRAALDILSGARAGEAMEEPPGLATSLPPAPPPGLPADLLSRRPDLRAAEMRLRASFDTREAVRASLYPDLVLTGAGGAASPALAHLFDHPVGSLLAAVSLPFLDLPRHRLNTAVARANQQIAELDFRKAVLRALADVDNALSRRTRLVEQRASLAAELTAAARAEDLYAVRYRSGAVPLRVWLEAQQNHRSARLALDANQLALLQNHAQLSAALGGGATQ